MKVLESMEMAWESLVVKEEQKKVDIGTNMKAGI